MLLPNRGHQPIPDELLLDAYRGCLGPGRLPSTADDWSKVLNWVALHVDGTQEAVLIMLVRLRAHCRQPWTDEYLVKVLELQEAQRRSKGMPERAK